MADETIVERDLELSHGFDAGNYCNAYETQDIEDALVMRDVRDHSKAYRNAFILGFFSSYELHEIPGMDQHRLIDAYHSEDGTRVLELGYTEARVFEEP